MDLYQPPQWLLDLVPEPARGFLTGGGWPIVLGILALLGVIVLIALVRALFSKGKQAEDGESSLREDLNALPAPPPLTADRRLQVEGVPVRLRMVVFAPAGRHQPLHLDNAHEMLEQVVAGLAAIAEQDKPVLRLWPVQLSDD